MTGTGSAPLLLAAFNTAATVDAERDATRCCASRSFAAAIAAGRPYPDLDALDAAIDAEFGRLGWADVAEAVSDHPRIGDPAAAGWSRAEQAGAAAAAADVAAGLAAGNQAYQEKFGHVFLVCASGLTAEQMLRQLEDRLGHDPATERRVVTDELRKITRQRMRKLLGG
jgi:2-oxo-4-hydroxy-4-carboxy-5-ureidoimidazoline decarboxylase